MKVKVIAINKVARQLLKDGFKMVDIKPHKDDYKRTVFIFELTPELETYLNKLEV